jgi:5-formyltetrahydrofolate cyclo-ligase
MTYATVASAKAALRLAVRSRRKALLRDHPAADWQAAEVAHGPLTARFPAPAGKVAALYRAMGSELDPRPLGEWLAEQGWTLALPHVESGDHMSFRRWAPGDAIGNDAAGLPAPLATAERVQPDLVIAPLLAFDKTGRRLGQGAGWYDRTLADLRVARNAKGGDVWVVGLAYSGQEVASVPTDEHDQRLDAILTEAGYRLADPEAGGPQTNQDD